jgi:hypothetical protein
VRYRRGELEAALDAMSVRGSAPKPVDRCVTSAFLAEQLGSAA